MCSVGFERSLTLLALLHSAPVWTRFDDASVTVVGGWDALCSACARGHLQPTVLFYERRRLAF